MGTSLEYVLELRGRGRLLGQRDAAFFMIVSASVTVRVGVALPDVPSFCSQGGAGGGNLASWLCLRSVSWARSSWWLTGR